APDGRVAGVGGAGNRVQLERVAAVGVQHAQRLLGQHPVVEVGQLGVGGGSVGVAVVRAHRGAVVVLQPVGALGLLGRGRAQAALGGRQPDSGAVSGGSHPAVQRGDTGV